MYVSAAETGSFWELHLINRLLFPSISWSRESIWGCRRDRQQEEERPFVGSASSHQEEETTLDNTHTHTHTWPNQSHTVLSDCPPTHTHTHISGWTNPSRVCISLNVPLLGWMASLRCVCVCVYVTLFRLISLSLSLSLTHAVPVRLWIDVRCLTAMRFYVSTWWFASCFSFSNTRGYKHTHCKHTLYAFSTFFVAHSGLVVLYCSIKNWVFLSFFF